MPIRLFLKQLNNNNDKTTMEIITTLVKIMASDFVLLIMAYFAQEQADRFNSKIARFFQHLFTWVIVFGIILMAICIIAIIWINN